MKSYMATNDERRTCMRSMVVAAFTSLPERWTDDMPSHQYATNFVFMIRAATRARHLFEANLKEAHPESEHVYCSEDAVWAASVAYLCALLDWDPDEVEPYNLLGYRLSALLLVPAVIKGGEMIYDIKRSAKMKRSADPDDDDEFPDMQYADMHTIGWEHGASVTAKVIETLGVDPDSIEAWEELD